jgi:hypothetical protein
MVTRYRDLQRPTLLQTGIVDNSAEQKAMALAGAFKGFGRVTSGILGDLNAQQGQQQGAVEGAAGKPQPKTGWRALTRFGESYNSAAEVTYSNKLQTDIHTRLSQIEMESEADPVKYQALSESYRDELVKTVPPEYAPRIGQVFDARMAAGNLRVGEQAVQLTQRTALASHLESQQTRIEAALEAAKGLTREDGDAALAETIAENGRQLEAFTWLDPVQKLQLEQSFIKDLDAAVAGQRIGSVVEEIGKAARVDVVEADRLVAELEASDQYTPEELTEIRGKVRQQRELLEYERSRLHYKDVANLTQRLSRDEYGVGVEREADRLYRMGAIGDGEYRGYMGRSAENADRVIKANAAATAAQEVMYLGGQLDPANPKHAAAITTVFDNEVAQKGAVEGDPRYIQAALALTKESRVLPKTAESWARKALMSNNPVAAAQAAGFMAQIREFSPGAYKWAEEPKLAAFSTLLQSNIDAHMDIASAYDLAHRNVYDVKPEEKALREDEYRDLTKDDPNDAYLRDALTKKRNWLPDVKPPDLQTARGALSMRAEYNSLVQQFYTTSGDLEAARKLADAQIQRGWGITEVNGEPEFSRYPLEQTYGFPADFIQADVKAQMAPYTDRPVRLEQIAATNRSKGLYWGVVEQTPNGNWEPVRDDSNRPAVYVPPLKTKEFDNTARRIAEADIEDLRRAREAYKAQEALIRPMLSPY